MSKNEFISVLNSIDFEKLPKEFAVDPIPINPMNLPILPIIQKNNEIQNIRYHGGYQRGYRDCSA